MQSNRVGWPTHNWWLLIFLFVYLQIIKSMWRVGMCEKNCRLSSLKLDCLSKKTLFSCSKLFRPESWPQRKTKKTEFEEEEILSWLQEHVLLFQVKGHQKHSSALQPYNCWGILCICIICSLSNIHLLNFLPTLYFTKCSGDCTEAQLCRKHCKAPIRETSPKQTAQRSWSDLLQLASSSLWLWKLLI